MPIKPLTTTTRRTAGERRDELIEAAIHAFAHTGLHGTAVSTITDRVGITQPYAFSLFRSKRGLFIAAVERLMDQFEAAVRTEGEAAPEGERFAAIKQVAGSLVSQPHILAFLLQGFAASAADPEINEVVRRRSDQLLTVVQEVADVGPEQSRQFLADGLLCMIGTTLNLDYVLPDGVPDPASADQVPRFG